MLLDVEWARSAAERPQFPVTGPDDGLTRHLHELQRRAARAQLASVLACTCRAARASADAELSAAKRAALDRLASAMHTVCVGMAQTPLWRHGPARASAIRLCGADTLPEFARCTAKCWQHFEWQAHELLLGATTLGFSTDTMSVQLGAEQNPICYKQLQAQSLAFALLRKGPVSSRSLQVVNCLVLIVIPLGCLVAVTLVWRVGCWLCTLLLALGWR